MQTDHLSFDIHILQTQFELKSSEFDQALKKDTQLAELKKIFHEMRDLHTKIVELRQSTGTHARNFKTNAS